MRDNEDNETVNDTPGRAAVTRRDLIRALGAAGVASAVGTGTVSAQDSTTTTTKTSGDGDPEYWMDRSYSDYVAQDEHQSIFATPSKMETAEMFFMSSGLGMAAIAGGATKRAISQDDVNVFDAGRNIVADIYMDPFDPGDTDAATVLQQAWYDIAEAHQLLERGITTWQADLGKNEELAHAEIELETRAAFNAGESMSTAKDKARQAVRDLFASVELNLLVLIEELLIRINGVFFRVAAELENSSLRDYWSFTTGFNTTHDYPGLHQPSMRAARVELMDGRVLDTGVLQILTLNETIDGGSYAQCHPLQSELRSRDKWTYLPDPGPSLRYDTTPVNYAPPDFLSDSEYRLLQYNQDLGRLCSDMYSKLWNLVTTFDAEIDAYVETMYKRYESRGKIPMSELSNAAVRRELGLDWMETGSTGFAIINALKKGMRANTEFSADVEILQPGQSVGEGQLIEDTIPIVGGDEGWVPGAAKTVEYDLDKNAKIDGAELHIKGQPANGQHTVTFSDGSTQTVQYGQLLTSGEWMSSDDPAEWDASFYIRLDSSDYSLSDIESVTVAVDEALFVGETYRIPDPNDVNAEIVVADYDDLWRSLTDPGQGIHIHSVTNAEGEEIDALWMRDGRQAELSTDGAEELMRRQVWTASERTAHRRKYDVPTAGGAGPDGGVDGWMYAVGGAVAAGAAAIGLNGGDE